MNAKDLFLSQQNSDHTRATYARGIAVFDAFVGKPYKDVTDEDLIAWKLSLSDMAQTSQFTRWTAVRSFFDWMAKTGRIPFSPFAAVKGPGRMKNRSPRIPSDVAYQTIVAMTPADCNEPRDWRDRAILRALGNGLRVSEVVALSTTDFYVVPEYEAHVLRVTGKGNKERIVPLSVAAGAAIEDWLHFRYDEGDALFTDFWNTGGRMTVRQVQSAVARRGQRVGIKNVNSHSLRHHYATRLIRAGAPAFSVQKLLGHESIATTQVYVNLDLTDAVAAARLDNV